MTHEIAYTVDRRCRITLSNFWYTVRQGRYTLLKTRDLAAAVRFMESWGTKQ